jgi:signal transduction histidine kinase
LNRAQGLTLGFAVLVAAAIGGTAWLAYLGVRSAFEHEAGTRLERLAELAASQVAAAEVADARTFGPDGHGLLALQLDALASASGLADIVVLDDSAHVVYAVREGYAGAGEPSRYDSLGSAALARARAGASAALPPFRNDGAEARAVAVPLPDRAGVLIAEDRPTWGPELARLRRDLGLLAAVSLLAVAALAAVVLRATGAQWALERRLARAENLAAMGRMTATLAHEIKNPLAIIRGSARRLGRLAPDAQAMADSVVEEVDRLSGTVNRYLQFARGATPDPSARGDAAATLVATVEALRAEAEGRGVRLAVETVPGRAGVGLDDDTLRQMWLNLLQNALEALTERGGSVVARCESGGGRVRVRVHDDGPGVPPELLARLGEPFLTTRAQGTGLGLFTVRQWAQGAGGALRVESAPGQGTTVVVELPVAE